MDGVTHLTSGAGLGSLVLKEASELNHDCSMLGRNTQGGS